MHMSRPRKISAVTCSALAATSLFAKENRWCDITGLLGDRHDNPDISQRKSNRLLEFISVETSILKNRMLRARAWASAVKSRNKIYLIGGLENPTDTTSAVAGIEYLDLADMKFYRLDTGGDIHRGADPRCYSVLGPFLSVNDSTLVALGGNGAAASGIILDPRTHFAFPPGCSRAEYKAFAQSLAQGHPNTSMFKARVSLESVLGNRAFSTAHAFGDDVMVIGGVLVDESWHAAPTNSTLFYNAATGHLRPGPAMHEPRARHTSIMLNSDEVLVVGGDRGKTPSAEIFNYATKQWRYTKGAPGRIRWDAKSVQTPYGILIAGGKCGAKGRSLSNLELYSAEKDSFIDLGAIHEIFYAIVMDKKFKELSPFDFCNPGKNIRASMDSRIGASIYGYLVQGRSYHESFAGADGSVFFAGGESTIMGTEIIRRSIERWDAETNRSTIVGYLSSGKNGACCVKAGVAVAGGMYEERYIVFGGEKAAGVGSREAEMITVKYSFESKDKEYALNLLRSE